MNEFRGIQGVEGREPIGAVVSVSRRTRPKGPPQEKEGFHILDVVEDNGLRPQHPAFRSFNAAPFEKRQTLQGVLVHHTENECFEWHRKAQIIGKPAHPKRAPHCVGDGVTARRWSFGEPDEFLDIQCLNDKCEFAIGSPPACKSWMRFVFLLTWPDGIAFPPMLVKFTSGSWNTLQNFVGFFVYIKKVTPPGQSLMGFPFSIQHTFQTNVAKRRRYQVIRITQRAEPNQFLVEQAEKAKAIQAQNYIAITDGSQQETDVVYTDHENVSWGKSNDEIKGESNG